MTDEFQPEEQKGLSLLAITHIIYGLFGLGVISLVFSGTAAVAALVVAYIKRGDAVGTIYAPHFDWVIKTFWWGLLWLVISAILTTIFIGWITGVVAVVWLIYRIVKGWLALASGFAPTPEY